MFGKLTKVKILILIGLVIGLLLKSESVVDYLKPYDETIPHEDTKILVHKDKNEDKQEKYEVQSKIAIMILNLGLEKETLELAKTLDKKIEFGLSIYTDNLNQVSRDILNDQRSLSLLLPTQSINSSLNDPGPTALLASGKIADNSKKFQSVISKLPSKEAGLYLNYDSIFTTRKDQAANIIRMLEDYSDGFKFFAYYDSDNSKFLTKLLESSTIKSKAVVISRILDSSLTQKDIVESLNNLAELSLLRNEVVIGAISPTKLSITTLNEWLQSQGDKVQLFSIEEILQQRRKN